ncbi:aminopeptidase [Clostridia bacterium]|nr:aminopeptidase [Clostridia bacterium]
MEQELQQLCALNGAAGAEDEVRAYIKRAIAEIPHKPGEITVTTDTRGNLLVTKKGKAAPATRLMLTAHMDEVAFIVTNIRDDGFIRFGTLGGINPSAIIGRGVYFPGKGGGSAGVNTGNGSGSNSTGGFSGVIGCKPVHLLSSKEKETQPKTDDLYADIGAGTKAEAETLVSPGDVFYYKSEFFGFGDGFVRGKAIDDRAGVAILLGILREELAYDTLFAFTTGEEVGTRGASAAVWNLRPDVCIVIEATTACDTPDNSGDSICKCGGGAVVSYMDKGTVYDKALYAAAFDTARELVLPVQTKTRVAGGNDAAAIHTAFGGVRTLAVSVPCRYLHTPSCVIKTEDMENTAKLVRGLMPKFSVQLGTR